MFCMTNAFADLTLITSKVRIKVLELCTQNKFCSFNRFEINEFVESRKHFECKVMKMIVVKNKCDEDK